MSKEAIYERAKESIIESDENMAMETLREAEAEGLEGHARSAKIRFL